MQAPFLDPSRKSVTVSGDWYVGFVFGEVTKQCNRVCLMIKPTEVCGEFHEHFNFDDYDSIEACIIKANERMVFLNDVQPLSVNDYKVEKCDDKIVKMVCRYSEDPNKTQIITLDTDVYKRIRDEQWCIDPLNNVVSVSDSSRELVKVIMKTSKPVEFKTVGSWFDLRVKNLNVIQKRGRHSATGYEGVSLSLDCKRVKISYTEPTTKRRYQMTTRVLKDETLQQALDRGLGMKMKLIDNNNSSESNSSSSSSDSSSESELGGSD